VATEQDMGIDERYQYLHRMQAQYQEADRRTRSRMLDQMMRYTGMHRKALIRRLGSDLTRPPSSVARGTYNSICHSERVWYSSPYTSHRSEESCDVQTEASASQDSSLSDSAQHRV